MERLLSGETEAGGVPTEEPRVMRGREASRSPPPPAQAASHLHAVALSKRGEQKRDLRPSPGSLAWSVRVPRGSRLGAEGVARGAGAGGRGPERLSHFLSGFQAPPAGVGAGAVEGDGGLRAVASIRGSGRRRWGQAYRGGKASWVGLKGRMW